MTFKIMLIAVLGLVSVLGNINVGAYKFGTIYGDFLRSSELKQAGYGLLEETLNPTCKEYDENGDCVKVKPVKYGKKIALSFGDYAIQKNRGNVAVEGYLAYQNTKGQKPLGMVKTIAYSLDAGGYPTKNRTPINPNHIDCGRIVINATRCDNSVGPKGLRLDLNTGRIG